MSRVSNIEAEAEALDLHPGVPSSWANRAGSAVAVKCRFFNEMIESSQDVFRPGQDSVMVAATLLSRFLTALTQNNPGSSFAIAGAVAFKALNNDARRATFDVDVSFQGNKNALFLAMLTRVVPVQGLTHNRFILPVLVLRAVSDIFRMYIKVGPTYGDRTLTVDHIIPIDILTNMGPSAVGSLGFPTNSVDRNLVLHNQQLSIHCINVLNLLDAKLKSYAGREARKDWDDIAHLMGNHGATIRQARDRFDEEARRFFLVKIPPGRAVSSAFVDMLYGRTPSPE